MAIDWIDGDVDAAFAQARALARPVLLFWGVAWCPACSRIRASVLDRPELATRALVAVQVDGDAVGAQRLAARLGVRSYPTLVLYRPDGAEITRLPCEFDGPAFLAALDVALGADVVAADALASALGDAARTSSATTTGASSASAADSSPADAAGTSPSAWRLLASYSWDTDENRLLEGHNGAATLTALAAACPVPDAAQRLCWLAVHAAGGAGESVDDVVAMLADSAAVRAQMDLVNSVAVDVVRAMSEPTTAARRALTEAFCAALVPLETDPTVSIGDQLKALRTRVRMARLGATIPGLADLVTERAAVAVAATDPRAAAGAATDPRGAAAGAATDPRAAAAAAFVATDPRASTDVCAAALHHVILNTAIGMLNEADLADATVCTLTAALAISLTPYYYMETMAEVAAKRGDTAAMLDWYEQAWDNAQGPATRLQWAANVLLALLDAAPYDAARINRIATALLIELQAMPDAACQRNRSQLTRLGKKLTTSSAAAPAVAYFTNDVNANAAAPADAIAALTAFIAAALA